MKNYSTKAFYNYARKLVEGDMAATSDIDTDFERVNGSQFRKMVAGASVGIVGALACLKYLDRYFSIASLSEAAANMKGYMVIASKENVGWFTRFMASLKVSIGNAIQWVLNVCGTLTQKAPWLKKPIISGTKSGRFNPSYGSVLSMALVGAAVGAVLYKIYKVIINRKNTSESATEYKLRQIKNIKKALKESNAMFSELNALTEGLDDEMVGGVSPFGRRIQAAADRAAAKATADAAQKLKEESFIYKMNAKIQEMWAGIKNFAMNYPVITVMVGLCAALVACWYGVKKYQEHKANTEFAAESVRPARRTRRMVRKSAYSF